MVDTSVGTGNGRSGKWSGPIPCPRGVTGSLPTISPAEVTRNVDHLEAAALLRAFGAGNASLCQALPALNAACDRVVDTFQSASAAIDAVVRERAIGAVAEACEQRARVVRQHAADGPEDRRRRTMWKWLVWAVLIVAALFDGAFVGTLVQRILDVDRWTNPMFYLSYLPGLGMALCLLTAGNLLAEHVFRRRIRISRRTTLPKLTPATVLARVLWNWRPDPVERRSDDLPWSRLFFPTLFAASVVGLLATAAYVRATTAGQQFAALADYQPAFVALLVLLSISAIAVKVQAHNPYADRAEEVAGQVKRAKKAADELVTRARHAVGDHGKAWNGLQSVIAGTESNAREIVEEACAAILEERGRTGTSGAVPLPLMYLRWPRDDDQLADDDTHLPNLNLSVLDHARMIFDDYPASALKDRLTSEVNLLHQEFETCSAVDGPTSASDPSPSP